MGLVADMGSLLITLLKKNFKLGHYLSKLGAVLFLFLHTFANHLAG